MRPPPPPRPILHLLSPGWYLDHNGPVPLPLALKEDDPSLLYEKRLCYSLPQVLCACVDQVQEGLDRDARGGQLKAFGARWIFLKQPRKDR